MIEYFIKNLIFFALTAVAFLLFKLILSKAKFKSDKDRNVLRYPLAYRLAPLCIVGYFMVVTLLVALFAKSDLIYVIVAGIVALGGVVTIVLWSLWRVEIKETEFVYTNILGKKRTYGYGDLQLTKDESGMKWFFYKGEEKVLSLPYFIQNREKLIKAYENYFC
ncbi:MAG: hypothetical protein J1F36_02895 [Clostridiales bacterium]|nr:hypothetical protein [Clostridiales bacterium]